jgi:TnpA family transposase
VINSRPPNAYKRRSWHIRWKFPRYYRNPFYRPARTVRYQHTGKLFADEAVDWALIENHWPDIMRVVLSIRAGRISSAALLRRLGSQSRRNRIYRAFRELGCAIRTIVLLRYLSEPGLREGITAITNRVEAFHGFARWLMFGGGVLGDNDPTTTRRSSSSTSCSPTAPSTPPPWT